MAEELFSEFGIQIVYGTRCLGGFVGWDDDVKLFVQGKVEKWMKCIDIFSEAVKHDMIANRKWLMDQTKFRSDENKRELKRTYSDIFGMEGSFRQLSFD